MADALPRERWILTAGVLFVVLGGLFPKAIVTRWSTEAEAVEQAFYPPRPSSGEEVALKAPGRIDPPFAFPEIAPTVQTPSRAWMERHRGRRCAVRD
jgi:hypothetical protein